MKNNIVTVYLYGKEICKLNWQGGYQLGFGKVGAMKKTASGGFPLHMTLRLQ